MAAGRIDDIFGLQEVFRDLRIRYGTGTRRSRRKHTESTFHRGRFNINTDGQVQAAMQKLREKGQRVLEAAKTALKEGVDLIVADAKSRCPVDTGKLRDSIQDTSYETGGLYILSADATNDKGIAYGQFVEFDPAVNRPFMYPAMEAHRQEVNDRIKTAIDRAIATGGG